MTEWLAVEAIVRQRDKEIMAANLAKLSSESNNSAESQFNGPKEVNTSCQDEVFSSFSDSEKDEKEINENGISEKCVTEQNSAQEVECDTDNCNLDKKDSTSLKKKDYNEQTSYKESRKYNSNLRDGLKRQRQISGDTNFNQNIVITNPSLDLSRNYSKSERKESYDDINNKLNDENEEEKICPGGLALESNSTCISPASSNGGVYPVNINDLIKRDSIYLSSFLICLQNELLDLFSLNLHRIDKDVQRCDRNYWYFMNKDNLEKLRNVMCTYVWEHLDQGYIQGMCDLVAPLLVIFDDGNYLLLFLRKPEILYIITLFVAYFSYLTRGTIVQLLL